MRELMFSLGSFAVAVGAVLLLVAVATNLLVGRALTNTEMLIAVAGSLVAGFLWWRLMRRNAKQHLGLSE
ncbi:MAG: hypothetical protein K0M66_00630 [Thiobacillus sp.]|nr:hypothetical protein [Thiobacillus sp.]